MRHGIFVPEPPIEPKEPRYAEDRYGLEIYEGEIYYEGPDGHIYTVDSIHAIRMQQTDEEWATENGYEKRN